MLKTYRPAGNSITLKSSLSDGSELSPFRFKLYQSGTASLSASILASINLSNHPAQTTEVILPAYACPDLISAILYAGAKPVLVDLEKNSPHLSIAQLKENISDSTVAIIAVNFLGIPEQVTQIRQVCDKHGLFLIVDSAQWFPKAADTSFWAGDFNIISFSRGKPLYLLSGGAVLTLSIDYYRALPDSTLEELSIINRSLEVLKAIVYNLAIQPYFYGIFTRLPGLKIGETIFKPLTAIYAMGLFPQRLIKSNIQKYQHQKSIPWEIHIRLKTISSQYLVDLLPGSATEENTVLLRYPILIKNRIIRDKFYRQTKNYGVSILYPLPLYEIPGLRKLLDNQSSFPHAREFSNYLVTLPTHDHVDEWLIDKIITKLKQVLDGSY